MKRSVSLVILDLDNTLWDWVGIWHASFKAMMDDIAQKSGLTDVLLKREFKAIHQRHRTCEYSFSIEELPSLRSQHPSANLLELYHSSIRAYRAARDVRLRPYPGVMETLQSLKDKGCLIVGYTESMAYYSSYRLRNTDLDRVMDVLYSPPDHDLPQHMTPDQKAKYRPLYELRRTVHRHTPKGELKPNPRILLDIIKEVGGTPETTIYIGDSKLKDIAMAQDAGVTDVWAKYGDATGRPEYELLKDVTHWSDDDVRKEEALRNRAKGEGLEPSFALENGFDEILTLFNFKRFNEPTLDKAPHAVEVWKKVVDVQQHFNDIELRIRNFAITLFAAVVSGFVLSIREQLEVHVGWATVPVASLVAFAGLIAWWMFYLMDHHWYHVFLKAAGRQANAIEARWAGTCPEFGLSTEISRSSRSRIFVVKIKKWTLFGGFDLTSSDKLRTFYYLGGIVLLLLALFAFSADVRKAHDSQPEGPRVRVPAQR